jgi:WXXGXW repeat (2 copies)
MDITRSINLKTVVATAMVAGALMLAPQAAQARVFVSVGIAPPLIPVYTQPLCPGDGYIWTPGYWAYGDDGYYWVDGAWVLAPYVGALWTPGYWGWGGGGYFWNAGYWGPTVGYYGGINYGFGYFGTGFYGGYWGGNRFFYNRAYNHINVTNIHNIYNHPYPGRGPHPGGVGYARDGGNFAGNRGAGIGSRPTNFNNGGHTSYGGFGNRGSSYAPGHSFAQPYNGSQAAHNFAQPYNGGQAAHNFAQPYGGQTAHNFAQPYGGGQARAYSAPSAPHNFAGGGIGSSHAYNGGGGFNGGGGGFHGGGGGFSGGGGGFHGGGGGFSGGGGGFHGGGGGGGFHGGGGGHR